MVFEPAKPSELLSAVRKVSDVLGAGYGKKPPHPPSSVDLARHGFGLKGKEEKLSGEEKKQKGHTYSPTVTKSRRTSTDKNPKTNDLALSGLTVLLVEDNVMNQQMARHSIVSYGVELTIVGDGEQAVKLVTEKLKENNFSKPAFDVILMDVMMPVKDGLVATREIRELESSTSANTNRHVIIGLSANVGTEYVNEVSDAGMDGVVSKPFYPATLRKALSDVSKGTYVGFDGKS
jgi:CheY-like chemotaxis protein